MTEIFEEYLRLKFEEIPDEVFPLAKKFFDENLNESFVLQTRKKIIDAGLNNWMTPYHFTTGMAIRNGLRDYGVLDDMFPDQNLDDYYVVLIEWWLGQS